MNQLSLKKADYPLSLIKSQRPKSSQEYNSRDADFEKIWGHVFFSEKCEKTEGMENPALIPDDRITSINTDGTDNVLDVRPGGDPWKPKVPGKNGAPTDIGNPTVEIDISGPNNQPTETTKVIIDGNVETVTITGTLENGTEVLLVSVNGLRGTQVNIKNQNTYKKHAESC